MSFREWWRNRSGRAKAVTVLSALLILQIGLCFGTPSIVGSFQTAFHIKPSGNEEFGPSMGYMFLEAFLALMTGIALLAMFVSYIISKIGRPKGDHD